MAIHHANRATPNIRLYETLIALAVGSIGAAAFSLTWGLLGYRVSAPVILLPFTVVFGVYLAGVHLYVWRFVGECEFSAWACAARLTEYRSILKLPLVKVWLLYLILACLMFVSGCGGPAPRPSERASTRAQAPAPPPSPERPQPTPAVPGCPNSSNVTLRIDWKEYEARRKTPPFKLRLSWEVPPGASAEIEEKGMDGSRGHYGIDLTHGPSIETDPSNGLAILDYILTARKEGCEPFVLHQKFYPRKDS